jgi:CheY-like chemotaxis protein
MKKILLQDGNEDLRNTMARYLSWYGLDVRQVGEINGAVSQLRKTTFDLFIFSLSEEKNENINLVQDLRWEAENLSNRAAVLATYEEEPELEECKIYRKYNISLQPKFSSPEKWYEKIQMLLQEKKS